MPVFRQNNLQQIFVHVQPTPEMQQLMSEHVQKWLKTFKAQDPDFKPRSFLDNLFQAIEHFLKIGVKVLLTNVQSRSM